MEQKYKAELDAVDKYIDNPYIHDIIKDYGFNLGGEFIPLDSNINVYEACFISLLVTIYIQKYKTTNTLNVLEIGLAYGTSALVIINAMLRYKHPKGYTVVDPNQSTQWKSIGHRNIDQFLGHMHKKLNYELLEQYSTDAVPKLRKKYDISFIDGSHEESIVIQDFMNSDKKLVVGGLIIADDVLHSGVKRAVHTFMKTYGHAYKRIYVNTETMTFKDAPMLYNPKDVKKSFGNPNTMYCFQKIRESGFDVKPIASTRKKKSRSKSKSRSRSSSKKSILI